MGVLVILRHGETAWNKQKLFTGRADIPLTPEGERQALRAGVLLSVMQFDAIYASPLKRAFNTATLILSQKIKNDIYKKPDGSWNIIIAPELIERDAGDFTGRSHKKDPEIINYPKGFDMAPPNGESAADVVKRITDFFEAELKPRLDKNETVLIVAHAGVVRAFEHLFALHGKEQKHKKVKNASPLMCIFNQGKLEDALVIQQTKQGFQRPRRILKSRMLKNEKTN
jgi:2,3-bisphosphoglycerate-dependent phosphoglycerate mutase